MVNESKKSEFTFARNNAIVLLHCITKDNIYNMTYIRIRGDCFEFKRNEERNLLYQLRTNPVFSAL